MEENTQEKNLIEKDKKSLFSKIKSFFKNIFGKKENNLNTVVEEPVKESNNEFIEYIKITEDEETKLLDLQERYRRGEIGQNDLSEEQIDALCNLYDKQIEELKKSIKIKEEKISEYKKTNQQNVEENNA